MCERCACGTYGRAQYSERRAALRFNVFLLADRAVLLAALCSWPAAVLLAVAALLAVLLADRAVDLH